MKWTRVNEILLFLIVFAIGFQKAELFGLKIVDYLILISFALLLARGKLFVAKDLYVVLSILFILMLVGLVFSINMSWSVGELVRYGLCFMLLAVLISFYREAERRQIGIILNAGIAYFVVSLGSAVLVWMHRIPYTLIFTEWDFRLEAFFFDPNFMSIFALFLVALMNYEYPRIRPLRYIFGIAVLALVILLSNSRTTIPLLVFVYFLSFALCNRLSKRAFRIMVLLAGAAIAVLDQTQILKILIARFEYRPEGNVPDIRFTIWANGLQAFFDNPFGYGPGTYRFVMERFEDFHDAHNTLLTWAVGDGVQFVLVIAVAGLYYLMFRSGSRSKKRFETLVLLAIAGTSLTFDMDTFRATWLMLSLIVYRHIQRLNPGRLPEAL